jgi:hypothetical protein
MVYSLVTIEKIDVNREKSKINTALQSGGINSKHIGTVN